MVGDAIWSDEDALNRQRKRARLGKYLKPVKGSGSIGETKITAIKMGGEVPWNQEPRNGYRKNSFQSDEQW